jgi:hypothetical protein
MIYLKVQELVECLPPHLTSSFVEMQGQLLVTAFGTLKLPGNVLPWIPFSLVSV